MAELLKQTWYLSEGDVDGGAADCTPYLDASETVSSVTSVLEVSATAPFDTPGTGDLTLANEQASSAELFILQSKVASAKAVQFDISGQQSGTTYRIRITFVTSNSRTKVVDQLIVCAA